MLNLPTADRGQGDTLPAKLLALRLATGMNGKEFAAAIDWDPSKVSRVENGRTKPSHGDVRAWANACGVPDQIPHLLDLLEELHATHRSWRKRARARHAAVQADYNAVLARSSLVSDFTMSFVPGLLQTPAYARRVFAEMIARSMEGLDEANVILSGADQPIVGIR